MPGRGYDFHKGDIISALAGPAQSDWGRGEACPYPRVTSEDGAKADILELGEESDRIGFGVTSMHRHGCLQVVEFEYAARLDVCGLRMVSDQTPGIDIAIRDRSVGLGVELRLVFQRESGSTAEEIRFAVDEGMSGFVEEIGEEGFGIVGDDSSVKGFCSEAVECLACQSLNPLIDANQDGIKAGPSLRY
jgi:hypothetical protein